MTQAADLDPVAACIGRRVALGRKLRHLSRPELARRAGGSSREVQDVERGGGEMTVSRLCEFGRALELPLSFFLDGLPADRHPGGAVPLAETPVYDIGKSETVNADLIALLREFERIQNQTARKHVLELVRALADALTSPH